MASQSQRVYQSTFTSVITCNAPQLIRKAQRRCRLQLDLYRLSNAIRIVSLALVVYARDRSSVAHLRSIGTAKVANPRRGKTRVQTIGSETDVNFLDQPSASVDPRLSYSATRCRVYRESTSIARVHLTVNLNLTAHSLEAWQISWFA
jgi:hypothetical protein